MWRPIVDLASSDDDGFSFKHRIGDMFSNTFPLHSIRPYRIEYWNDRRRRERTLNVSSMAEWKNIEKMIEHSVE